MRGHERFWYLRKEDIPENWQDHQLQLFVEDDAQVPDKERVYQASQRFISSHVKPIHKIDDGDALYTFYSDGHVVCNSYDGGYVALLLKEPAK